MANFPLLNVFAALLAVCYPFFVYFGLQQFDARVVASVLILIAVLRLLAGGKRDHLAIITVACALLIVVVTYFYRTGLGLLAYPVLVSFTFLFVFLHSVFNPPTIIERLARRADPNLPDAALGYIRKVTLVWCGFFLINGLIALATIFMSKDAWLLYNGFISYMLIGALFAGEWLVRKRVSKNHHD